MLLNEYFNHIIVPAFINVLYMHKITIRFHQPLQPPQTFRQNVRHHSPKTLSTLNLTNCSHSAFLDPMPFVPCFYTYASSHQHRIISNYIQTYINPTTHLPHLYPHPTLCKRATSKVNGEKLFGATSIPERESEEEEEEGAGLDFVGVVVERRRFDFRFPYQYVLYYCW